MARNLKIPLKMNGIDVRNIKELRDNFDLEAVCKYFKSGDLVQWLRCRLYNDEADKIGMLDPEDNSFSKKLANVLGVEISNNESFSLADLENRIYKMEELRKYIDDNNIIERVDIIAFDQDELDTILKTDTDIVYLFKGTFCIPNNIKCKKIIGIEGAKVILGDEILNSLSTLHLQLIFENVEFAGIDDPKDMLRLGVYFTSVNRKDEAFKLYKKSAEMKYEKAFFSLAECYYMGNGIERDPEEAARWYEKAAKNGEQSAKEKLGQCYYEIANKKCYNNSYLALNWYRKAAEFDHEKAKQELKKFEKFKQTLKDHGESLHTEKKTEPQKSTVKIKNKNIDYQSLDFDDDEYLKLFPQYDTPESFSTEKIYNKNIDYKSADFDDDEYSELFPQYDMPESFSVVEQIYRLGKSYIEGNGGKKDHAKAAQYFEQSAEQNYAPAQCELGLLYMHGDGVEKNVYIAQEWLKKSAAQGYKKAQDILEKELANKVIIEEILRKTISVNGELYPLETWKFHPVTSNNIGTVITGGLDPKQVDSTIRELQDYHSNMKEWLEESKANDVECSFFLIEDLPSADYQFKKSIVGGYNIWDVASVLSFILFEIFLYENAINSHNQKFE